MPRHARDYFLSDFLHIMVQGDEKKFIFKTSSQKEKFILLMYKAALFYGVEIVAYCIMGNHAHLLVYCRNVRRVSDMLHKCNTAYGLYYNKGKKSVGHVFRDRFLSENIHTKKYLMNCIRYIHQNPVKAGICRSCGDYPYSSYHDFLNQKKDYLLESNYFLKEDLEKILQESECETEEKYLELEELEDFEQVSKEIYERYPVSELANADVSKIYEEVKNRCNLSDDKIAEFLGITRGKLRRILHRERVK